MTCGNSSMYSHACFLPSAQHRNVFQGVLSERVQYLMRAIRILSSSAFMTAATACSTLCGSQISLIPFRTLALPWNAPEMTVSNRRRGHESSFFGGGVVENRWGRVRGELHGRLKRSPPSRRFRCRRGLIIGAPQCIEFRGCHLINPRHVARGLGSGWFPAASRNLARKISFSRCRIAQEPSAYPRAAERGSAAIPGYVAVRHDREGGLQATADRLPSLDPGARGAHPRVGACARENTSQIDWH